MKEEVAPDTLVTIDSYDLLNIVGTSAYVIWCSFLYQTGKGSPFVDYTIDLLVERLPQWGAKRSFSRDIQKASLKSEADGGPAFSQPKTVPSSRSTIRRALAALETCGLVKIMGKRQKNGRYRREVRGCLCRKVGKQYVPAGLAHEMGVLPEKYTLTHPKEEQPREIDMGKEQEIKALLSDGKPLAAKASQDTGMDAVARDEALDFGLPLDAVTETREYYTDVRVFPKEVEMEDREPTISEFGQDTMEIGDPTAYSNPTRFVPGRLVHPSIAYETDIPPLVVQSRGINRHKQRLIVSEYEHPVFGRYFNHVREDLVVDFELPSWNFDDFGYDYPEIPALSAAMTEREQVVLMINAYQAGIEYYTKKQCVNYENGMSMPEKNCVLASARRLLKAGVKPHLWVVSYLGTLKQVQKNPWDPKKDKPPRITRVFNPKTVEKYADEGKIEMPTPYYETPTASKVRIMTRSLSQVIWHLRHYEYVMQQDIDDLAKRRILQLERMMDTVRGEYRDRFAQHTVQMQKGRWVWGGSLE